MGFTGHSMDLSEEAILNNGVKSVCELGAQNIYFGHDYGKYANLWYERKGLAYTCIDQNGENNAHVVDLGKEQKFTEKFDLLTDYGTSEHVDGFYNCWLNKWALSDLIISENPKTGNWPGHGQNYVTENFYKQIARETGAEIIKLGEHPAMSNTTDGWNIFCVLRKNGKFVSEDIFNQLEWHER